MDGPAERHARFPQRFLGLSRACLGKMMMSSIELAPGKKAFSAAPGAVIVVDSEAHHPLQALLHSIPDESRAEQHKTGRPLGFESRREIFDTYPGNKVSADVIILNAFLLGVGTWPFRRYPHRSSIHPALSQAASAARTPPVATPPARPRSFSALDDDTYAVCVSRACLGKW